MKYTALLIMCLLLSAASMHGQYIQDRGILMERDGKNLVADGKKLSPESAEILLRESFGRETASAWAEAGRRFRTGKTVLIASGGATFAGAALTTAGAVWYSHYYDNKDTDTMKPGPLVMVYTGTLTALAGIAGLCAGSVIYVKSAKRMDRIIDRCNSRHERQYARTSISIGAQRNGIGIAVNLMH